MTHIHSNGSKWAGQSPDEIEKLCEVLQAYPLDSTFEKYGNFVIENPCHARREYLGDGLGSKWVDGKPIYPGRHVVSFFGNFLNLSHVFNIDTDDKYTIERLTWLIRANQQRADYGATR